MPSFIASGRGRLKSWIHTLALTYLEQNQPFVGMNFTSTWLGESCWKLSSTEILSQVSNNNRCQEITEEFPPGLSYLGKAAEKIMGSTWRERFCKGFCIICITVHSSWKPVSAPFYDDGQNSTFLFEGNYSRWSSIIIREEYVRVDSPKHVDLPSDQSLLV